MNMQELAGTVPQQKTAPESMRKILMENEQVEVIESNYPVGEGVPLHTHRFPHVLYVIDGGKVEVTNAQGKASEIEFTPGQVLWHNAQTHSTRNVGASPIRILEVELKNAPVIVEGKKAPFSFTPEDLKWVPDPMDPTRKTALMVGDPTQPGPYVARFMASVGYVIDLHQHPSEDEYLTVISGSMHWSTGPEGSEEHVLPAGGFVMFPAGTPHRIWVTENTILQLTGIGPRSYQYIDRSKDPRLQQ